MSVGIIDREVALGARREGDSEPGFLLENILTISAEEYCTSVGRYLKDYRVVGVHVFGQYGSNARFALRDVIPPGTEVIVAYKPSVGGDNLVAISGTALIPKKKVGGPGQTL